MRIIQTVGSLKKGYTVIFFMYLREKTKPRCTVHLRKGAVSVLFIGSMCVMRKTYFADRIVYHLSFVGSGGQLYFIL